MYNDQRRARLRRLVLVQENLVQLQQLFGIFSLTPLYCIYWLPVCENHLDLMELCNIADILERLELLETT